MIKFFISPYFLKKSQGFLTVSLDTVFYRKLFADWHCKWNTDLLQLPSLTSAPAALIFYL